MLGVEGSIDILNKQVCIRKGGRVMKASTSIWFPFLPSSSFRHEIHSKK